MARPIETGLGYFPMDTGFFSDRKIRKLLKTFDAKGYLIYSFVLCEIYKDKGYFVKCDNDFLFDISDTLNQSESLVKEVIQFCVINGLFDKRVFDVENVLTSIGVQKRYLKIKNWPVSKLDKKYIISLECGVIEEKHGINQEEHGDILEKPPINGEIIPQSKEKQSKEKQSKEPPNPPKKGDCLAKKDFIDEIIDCFIEKYKEIRSIEYVVTNNEVERSCAGKLLKIYKKQYPDADSITTLEGFKTYFNSCLLIADEWLNKNMGLPIIISKFNQINNILKNENKQSKNGSGATNSQLAGVVVKHFAVDSQQ